MTADLMYAFAWTARTEQAPRSGQPDRAVAAELAHAVLRLLALDCRSGGTVRCRRGGRPLGHGG